MGKTGYDFYLNKCLLPITPNKLQVKINNANSKVTLIDEGQINILNLIALYLKLNIRLQATKADLRELLTFLIILKN